MSPPKYALVAARVRAEIADGVLKPGEPVSSGAALARVTGYSVLTCRRGLNMLIKEGVLVPGPSASARPRVPGPASTQDDQARATAARSLSAALATRRRAAGLTQPQLAAMTGVSITTIGHAETGRLWQSRRFWEHADKELNANGELLARHDAYRAAATAAGRLHKDTDTRSAIQFSSPAAVAIAGAVACITITWADGAVTVVYPPQTPARPATATPESWPRGLFSGSPFMPLPDCSSVQVQT